MENQLENLVDELSELSRNSLGNQRSDFTQWNLVEAIEAIAFEFKRYNDRQENK